MRKLLLLHGAGITSSRKALIDLKQQFDPNNIVVFGEGSSLEEINNNLAATPLFSTDRLVILENPPEDFTDYTLTPNPYTFIFWFDHEIPTHLPIISWTLDRKGEILFYPESKEVSVFPFLDLLAEGNKRAFVELNKLKLSGFDIFYFITMTYYLLRILISIPKRSPKFVQNKLKNQRMRFQRGELEILYKNILELEFRIKSGFLGEDMAEFFLVHTFVRN